MSDAVLVLNSGSSSVKFALFDSARSEPTMRYKGLLDEQEKSPRLLVTDPKGKTLFERRHAAADNEDKGLFIDIFDWIENIWEMAGSPASGIASYMAGATFLVRSK